MGVSKTEFQLQREWEESDKYQIIDNFFSSNTITIDVRVSCRLDVNEAERMPKSILKKNIRKEMLSNFRKELTKQLNDQI